VAAFLLGGLAMRLSTAIVPLSLFALAACSDDFDGPGEHILARSTQLVQYESCNELEADLKNMVIHEIWADIERADQGGWGRGGLDDAAGDASGSPGEGGGRQEGVDYSGTNNQEQGVDEADFVKTDGYHIYTLNGNRLHIMGVPEFGQLTAESVTKIEGHPRQMLLDGAQNRLVVFSYIDTYSLPADHPLKQLVGYQDSASGWRWRINQLSKVTVLDISNKLAPRLVREVFYEGWYQTARKVDSSIRMGGYSLIEPSIMWGWGKIYEDSGHNKVIAKNAVRNFVNRLALADFIPQIYVRMPDGHFETNSLSEGSCRSFHRPTDSHARGISSIISFDLLGESLHWDADHVVSNWTTFYASQDTLLLAEPAHDWWWYWWYQDDPDQLNIHSFDISVPGQTRYAGSGRVDGQIVDQFSLDEDKGAIRVATTTGLMWRWWAEREERPELENHVWVLEDHGAQLDIVGHVGGIAKGERIMSSRFQGDKGYLVTFESIDPLFTLDLTDRTNPRVIGELKVPGFSTYLHPIADGKLLSIGVDPAQRWRTQVSLFDVSDFAAPRLDMALPVEAQSSWGWSEALYDHKAFQYWAPKKLLAIPQSTYAHQSFGGEYTYRYLSQLVLVNVDPANGVLGIKGRIDHSPYYDAEGNTRWRYVDIRRSIFMGDYVYAISDKAITAHHVTDLGKVAEQTLPGYTASDYYWWW
jgi:hypothetical protein